jgi:hypothetical protein
MNHPSAPERLHHRPQQKRRLEALAGDRDETDRDQRPDGAVLEGAVDAGFERVLHGATGAAHPEDHPRDHRDGEEREASAEDLLGLERQAVGAESQDCTEAEGEHDRQRDAGEHPPYGVFATELSEIGDEDADDERGLEPLTEADQEGCEHGDQFIR